MWPRPTGRAVVVLGFMTYFVLFAVLMGGLYLAIDSTAGERERGSLEALLSLPVARSSLVGGKILATCAYMCISLALSLDGFRLRVPLRAAGKARHERQLGRWHGVDFFCNLPALRAAGRRPHDLGRLVHAQLSRGANLPHQPCCWCRRCPSPLPAFIP